MALPSTIPTSFVPHQQFVANQPPRPKKSGRNVFLIVALAVLAVTAIAAGGTFAYEKYLQSVRDSKEATLAQEQQGIDPSTVAGFVALSNRLAAANTILNQHITLSSFFDLLEGITLQSVSITSLDITVADDRTATLTLAGTAKTFNALAAESAAFAQQPLIKHAIFSGLDSNKDGSVDFTVAADLDPKLVVGAMPPAAASSTPPAATSTASTTVQSTASTTAAASSTPPATLTPPPAAGTVPPPASSAASTAP